MNAKFDFYSLLMPQRRDTLLKFILASTTGVFIYFIPFTFAGKKTIFLDHLVTAITTNAPALGAFFALLMILMGSLLPFYEKSWNLDLLSVVMTGLKLLGAVLGVMAFFQFGPAWLMRPDMLPLLFYTVAISVALIIPLGSFFLTFLTDFGLLGFLGILLQPVMRPLWKVPGIAAVNMVTSVIGSFSVGIFMADQLYKERKFTRREGAVIMTGFSTVSATFMVIIARNLDLMPLWNTFFWVTVLVTFLVSAIMVRLPPLKNFGGQEKPEEPAVTEENSEHTLLWHALKKAMQEAENNKNVAKNIQNNVKEGITMSLRFLPLILSIGTIGFYMAKMTTFFDFAASVFYPFVLLLSIPEPLLVSKVIVTTGVDVIMPSLMMSGMGAPLATRFAVGVVSISSILFLAGTIPCILSTAIRISLKDLLIILMERMVLTLLVVSLLIRFLF